MLSVVRFRPVVQWSFCGFVFMALVVLVGCQPAKVEQKMTQGASSSGESATAETSASETEATKPAENLPGVDTPVKGMPDAEPTSEPAKDSEEKTSAVEAPVAAQVANDAAADDLTTEPTTSWLPKPTENPDAEAQDEAEMKPYTEKIENADLTFDMVPIPGGTFTMGSPDSEEGRNEDEGPQVKVKIEPFWMGKCEVTWQEYEQWGLGLDQQRRKAKNVEPTLWNTAADALAIPTKPYADMSFGMGKDGYPAVCMTQFAAKMYCKWLSAKTGRYYRLPTEAEWEYACRAGTDTPYSFGADAEQIDDYAWYEGNSEEKYQKVGQKKPNPWGLHDMHGNVAEWCLDQYVADRYKQLGDGVVENPLLPVTKMYPHAVRGGAWTDEAEMLRSAARRGSTRDWKSQDPQIPQSIWYFTDANFVGFRVVRPLRTPTPEEAAKYEVTDFEKEELIDYKKAQAGKQ